MNSEVLLSICIPTYNRAYALKECLHNITAQDGFDQTVEVVITDNASTDDTEALVDGYRQQYPNIRYYKNAENVGMEKNFVLVMQKAQGKLIKLFNDYSLMKPGTLKEMKEVIEQNADESSILYFYNFNQTPYEQTCTDFNQLLRRITYWITWIGGFSIWKNDYDRLEHKERFEGLLFYHMLMLIENFKQKRSLKIYSKVWFGQINNIPKGGYDFFVVFIKNFIGETIFNLYQEKYINTYTLYKVKRGFLSRFIKPWLNTILLQSKTSTFVMNAKGLDLLHYHFRFYPEYYWILLNSRIKQRFNHIQSD